jgi:hypothetical protein
MMDWWNKGGSSHGFFKVTISVFAWSGRNDGTTKNNHFLD